MLIFMTYYLIKITRVKLNNEQSLIKQIWSDLIVNNLSFSHVVMMTEFSDCSVSRVSQSL